MNSEIKFFDPNINRKKDIVSKSLKFFPNSDFPLPSEVEISESGTCNRKCSFCPRSDPNFEDIMGKCDRVFARLDEEVVFRQEISFKLLNFP